MIEISCVYADDDEFNDPINITFIKYEKFMKIAINERKMIIRIENLKKSQFLFEYYILSLLCTKDLNKTYLFNNEIYCVLTNKYWNNSIFSDKYNDLTKIIKKVPNNCLFKVFINSSIGLQIRI